MRPRCAALLAVFFTTAGCRRDATRPAEPLAEAFHPADISAAEDRGRRSFIERCSTCHGAEGHGDGQNAYNLDPPPPDMSESLGSLSETQRRLIIEKGSIAVGRSPLCPPSGRVLVSDEIDDLLAYLRRIERTNSAATPQPRTP
jgi:mono/diheme cytochrome c family protein